ncbi:MAG: iron-containing alcohol dehydrogenase family protein [Halobacteriaceae archaeon]
MDLDALATRDGNLGTEFTFTYDPPRLRCGRDVVRDLATDLSAIDVERALVMTGETVGRTAAVMDPIRTGLGDRTVGEFAETTPAKRLGTAAAAARRIEGSRADSIVAVGGGSTLDVAKQASVLVARSRASERSLDATLEAAADEFADRGTLTVPDAGLLPIIAIPTTLAGADLSQVAGATMAAEGPFGSEAVSGGLGASGLMPAVVVWDSTLLATTPEAVITGSAMNGFDKGLEALYAANRTPITDATATHGLESFAAGLRAFGAGNRTPAVYDALARGSLLVQYGISRPDGGMLSLIHAFGHGLTAAWPIQQGVAHAVIAPHALEYLFEAVDGRRRLLATALDVEGAADPARAVIEAIMDLRDGLGLPRRLRAVDGTDRGALDEIARRTHRDSFMANAPPGLEPTVEELEEVLEAAW